MHSIVTIILSYYLLFWYKVEDVYDYITWNKQVLYDCWSSNLYEIFVYSFKFVKIEVNEGQPSK